jgi:hypothetical protein
MQIRPVIQGIYDLGFELVSRIFSCLISRLGIGLADFFRPLLVLIVEGTVPGERTAPILVLVLAVAVAKWSDGTVAAVHQEQIDHYAIERPHVLSARYYLEASVDLD